MEEQKESATPGATRSGPSSEGCIRKWHSAERAFASTAGGCCLVWWWGCLWGSGAACSPVCWGRRTTCGRAPDGRYSCCPWPACWWCGCTAGAASKRPGNRPYHPGCPGEQPVSRLLAPGDLRGHPAHPRFWGIGRPGGGGPAAGGSLAELVRKGESWGPSFRTWRSCAV